MAEPQIHQVVDHPAPPASVMSLLQPVATADAYRVQAYAADRLVLLKERWATWVIVLAIILFPLGLLFLLVPKEQQTVTISLEPLGDGTRVHIVGSATRVLQSAIQYALGGQAQPPGLSPGPAPSPPAAPPPAVPPPG